MILRLMRHAKSSVFYGKQLTSAASHSKKHDLIYYFLLAKEKSDFKPIMNVFHSQANLRSFFH